MHPEDPESERELGELLHLWQPPDAPAHLKPRLRRAYAQATRKRGLRWFLHGELRLPVPLALAGAAAVLLFAALLYGHPVHMIAAPQMVRIAYRDRWKIQEVAVYRDRDVIRYRNLPATTCPAFLPSKAQSSPTNYQFVSVLTPEVVRAPYEDHN